ncbi:MAG: DUF72 domain-containing protein [Kiritimatiellia bacterium]|jgi:uncharacterized protein YecE (DUF72 family)|nr:DUF72 domain-containing protein [Kiritimatiellia bacterium]MDP6629643.1 DUF72 domain-containing protein [Kiritimatiellia bacterium]MDP6811087.1 DUF72 domain-containing protein [Kiritimatiellia bacterium]MDP7024452.1 DUF72 domain-containing protein [Kiritimatiellia bacterium]
MTTSLIKCGIAGWSYKDWDGYVYPRGVKDKLRYVAEYVDVVEVNSTFYRPPDARMVASWAERTADLDGFTFTAKLNQEVTHRGRVEAPMVRAFHDGLAPLVECDRLSHLLAQFRYDFADTPETRAHLERIYDAFGSITNLTLELRHNSWQAPGALDFLRDMEITVANLDYPTAKNSFNLRYCDIGEHAYLRLHGRNAKAWFSKSGRDETYNYLYSKDEMDSIAERAAKIATMSKSLTLIANNHYQGKEFVNALEARAKLSGGKVAVPAPLLERYPQLREITE